MSPSSPACGFNASTAILGFTIPKSLMSDWFMIWIFRMIRSSDKTSAIRLTGICPVIIPILKSRLTISIRWSGQLNLLAKYSECPGNWKVGDWIFFLLMGAVTTTSISFLESAAVAASSESKASSPAMDVDFPRSIFTSSSWIFTIFGLRGCAWSVLWITLKLKSVIFKVLR